MRPMSGKVLIVLLLVLVLLLSTSSCARSASAPKSPKIFNQAKQTPLAGRAFYSSLAQADYAEPTTFSISADSLTKGEILTLAVNEDYIYKYYYITVNGQWQKRAFPQATAGSSSWIKSSASVSVDTNQLKEGSNFVVVYSCTKTGSSWNCHNNKWQIHEFKILLLPVFEPQCGSDQECPYANACVNNKCVPKPCTIDADCPVSFTCKNGACAKAPWPDNAYHVDGSYTGTVSDGSKQKPWKTISEAAAFSLKPGDFVVVHPGTYRESVKLNHKGEKEKPIAFLADGEVVIKGSDPIVGWEPDAQKAGCYVHKNWIYKEPYVMESEQLYNGLGLYEKLRKKATDQEVASYKQTYGNENVAVVSVWDPTVKAYVQKADFTEYYKKLGITFTWKYDENWQVQYFVVKNWDKGMEFLRKEFPDVLYALSSNQVFVDEKPLREVVRPDLLKPGTFYIAPQTKDLSVCLADSSTPVNHKMDGSARDVLVNFNKDSSSLVFKGFKLRHASSPITGRQWVPENAVQVLNENQIKIVNPEQVRNTANAVELWGTNHVFENNEINYVNGQGLAVQSHLKHPGSIAPNYDYAELNYKEESPKWHLGHVISGNTIQHSGFLGVGSPISNGVTFHNNIVRFNSFKALYLSPSWAAGGMKLHGALNWDIKGLKSYYNYYHGFWCDTACFGNKIQHSIFYGNNIAIRFELTNAKMPEQGNLVAENLIYSNVEGVDYSLAGYLTVSNNLIAYNDIGITTSGGTVSSEKTNKFSGNLITDHEVNNVGYSAYTPDAVFDNNLYYGVTECHFTTHGENNCPQLNYWKRQAALEKDIDSQDLSAEEKQALKIQLRYVHGEPNWNAHLALRSNSYIKMLADWQQATDVWSKDAAFTYYDYANAAPATTNWNKNYKGTYPSANGSEQFKTYPLPDIYKTEQYQQIQLKPDQNSVYADPKYKDPVNANFCLADDSPARAKNIGPAALHKCKPLLVVT